MFPRLAHTAARGKKTQAHQTRAKIRDLPLERFQQASKKAQSQKSSQFQQFSSIFFFLSLKSFQHDLPNTRKQKGATSRKRSRRVSGPLCRPAVSVCDEYLYALII